MARNGSGVYSKVNTFVAGNTVTAAGHDQNWDDLVAEMTNSVAADGQTTITAPLKGANGSQAAPSYSFASDLTSGFWRIGAGNIGIGVSNTKIVDISSTGVTITGALIATTLTGGISGLNIIGATQLTAPANNDTLPIYDLSTTTNSRILLSDFFKVINDFTADGSPDISADYVVTYDTSATAPKKVLLANIPSNLPRGHMSGCILSNGTDTTNDINITAGKCRDSTDAVDIVVSANTAGKQLDANWAASGTTNSGMRNSAAGIANGTYHLYAARTAASTAATIYAYAGVAGTDPDSSAAVSAMLTALQAETGGSSYIYARRIGSIVRAGATILQFVQVGDCFTLKTAVIDITDAASGTSAKTATLVSIPLGPKMMARLSVIAGNTAIAWISDPDCNDQAPSSTTFLIAGSVSGGVTGAYAEVFTNTSSQIRYRQSVNVAFAASTIGWRDLRGKDS